MASRPLRSVLCACTYPGDPGFPSPAAFSLPVKFVNRQPSAFQVLTFQSRSCGHQSAAFLLNCPGRAHSPSVKTKALGRFEVPHCVPFLELFDSTVGFFEATVFRFSPVSILPPFPGWLSSASVSQSLLGRLRALSPSLAPLWPYGFPVGQTFLNPYLQPRHAHMDMPVPLV